MRPGRWFVAGLVAAMTVAVTAAGVEALARHMALDRLQLERVAVAQGERFGGSHPEAIAPAWRDRAARLREGYLPAGFQLHEAGYESQLGACRFDHGGPTVLAMGDSTTVMTADPASHNPPMGAGDPSYAWPAMLAAQLAADVQVCTIAELGFHPRDHERFLAVLAPALQPSLVVVLLCNNDLEPLAPRVRQDDADGSVYFSSTGTQMAHSARPWTWLFARSEAWRFLHWRAAQRWPEGAISLPSPRFAATPAAESLQGMRALAPRVELFYLPQLRDEQPLPTPALQALGVPTRVLDLPSPRQALRYNRQDPVHMNADGHRAVLEAMLPIVQETLALQP